MKKAINQTLLPNGAIRFIETTRRLFVDRKGVGAIEFAIIAPVLLLLYLGAVQITIGLSVSKRASRATGAIADIVTQQQADFTKSFLATMPNVAGAVFAPYATTSMTLKITGVALDASANATVAWSWSKDGTRPYGIGTAVTSIPTDLKKANTFLVRSEFSVPYNLISFGPDFLPASVNQITIQRQYFYRLRQGSSISCTDC